MSHEDNESVWMVPFALLVFILVISFIQMVADERKNNKGATKELKIGIQTENVDNFISNLLASGYCLKVTQTSTKDTIILEKCK